MRRSTSFGVFTILVLIIVAFVFAQFQGGFVSWFLFYFFLPIGLFSLLQYFFVFKGMSINRKVSRRTCTAGDSIEVTFEIHNPYRFPLFYLVIKDDLPSRLKMGAKGYETVIYPWFKQVFTFTYEINDIPRGVYDWDEITLQTGDIFGFIKREKQYDQYERILVYPQYQEIVNWQTYNEKNIGMAYTKNFHQAEDVTSVMGARDYVPGDRLSRIHWKASAKSLGLKTKEFEHQVTNDFMFFLDREKRAYGDIEHPLFEKAVSLTASLARFALKRKFSAGLVSYGKEKHRINLNRNEEQLFRIFEHLAHVQADATFSFVKTVLKEVVYLPVGTTVVIISPRLTEKMALMMGELSYRKIKVEFFWIKAHRETSEEEKRYMGLLEQEQIAYYIVSGKNFSQVLQGGDNHVSA